MSQIIEAPRELGIKRENPKEARARIKEIKDRLANQDGKRRPPDSAFDIFNDYFDALIKDFEQALTKRAGILERVPEREREKTEDLMETAESLALVFKEGDFPTREQIEAEFGKENL